MWSVLDQALSSLTNFGLAIVVAATSSTSDLGAFELTFSLYLFVLGFSRALTTEPLLVRYSDQEEAEVREAGADAVGTALMVGVGASILALTVAAALGGSVRAPIAALAVVLPGLMVQDAWRYVFFTAGRPAKALANDTLWAVAQGVLVAWLLVRGAPSVTSLILVWGASASFTAALGMAQAGTAVRPTAMLRWLRRHRDLAPRFVGEFSVGQGAAQMAVWLIGAIGGLAVLGALRAGLVLISPVRIFLTAAPAAAIPEFIRVRRRSEQEFRRLVIALSGGLTAMVAAWSLAVLALPDRFGEAALGDNWEPGRRLFPVLVLGWAFLGLGTGAMIGLRVLADARRSLKARLIISPLVIVAPPLAALAGRAMGAAVGLTIVSCWTAAVWWYVYRQAAAAAGACKDGAPRYPDSGDGPAQHQPIGGMAQ